MYSWIIIEKKNWKNQNHWIISTTTITPSRQPVNNSATIVYYTLFERIRVYNKIHTECNTIIIIIWIYLINTLFHICIYFRNLIWFQWSWTVNQISHTFNIRTTAIPIHTVYFSCRNTHDVWQTHTTFSDDPAGSLTLHQLNLSLSLS